MAIARSNPKATGSKKSAHGGERTGAGRPQEYDAPRVKTSLRRDLHGMFAKTCTKTKCSLTRALDFVIGRIVQDPSLENALRALAAGNANSAKDILSSHIVVKKEKKIQKK